MRLSRIFQCPVDRSKQVPDLYEPVVVDVADVCKRELHVEMLSNTPNVFFVELGARHRTSRVRLSPGDLGRQRARLEAIDNCRSHAGRQRCRDARASDLALLPPPVALYEFVDLDTWEDILDASVRPVVGPRVIACGADAEQIDVLDNARVPIFPEVAVVGRAAKNEPLFLGSLGYRFDEELLCLLVLVTQDRLDGPGH